MPGLLRFSKVPEGPSFPLRGMARTPFALMQQCPPEALSGCSRQRLEEAPVSEAYKGKQIVGLICIGVGRWWCG
jgi:hypothetical protein